KKIAETEEKLKGVSRNSEEGYKLDQEHTDLINIKKERIGETVDKLQEQSKELQSSIDKEQEKIDKLKATEQQMVNIKLANVGINEEGEKGLEQLDKSISKSEKELAKLDKQKKKNGELTEKQKERYEKLSETVEKQKEAKDAIYEEFGVYNDLNSLVQSKLELAEQDTQKKVESLAKSIDIKTEESNIVKQIKDKNSELDKSISKLEEEKGKQGANKDENNKQIQELQNKKSHNAAVIEQILKELGLWGNIDDAIKDGIKSEKEKGKATDDTTKKQKGQGKEIDNNNKKTDEGVKKEKERTKEASKNVDKDVKV